MSALTLTLIRLAFLAVLWLFVIAAVGVVRTDLFGSTGTSRRQARKAARAPRPRQAPQARAPKPGRPARGRPPQQIVVTMKRSGRNDDPAGRPADHHRPGQ